MYSPLPLSIFVPLGNLSGGVSSRIPLRLSACLSEVGVLQESNLCVSKPQCIVLNPDGSGLFGKSIVYLVNRDETDLRRKSLY